MWTFRSRDNTPAPLLNMDREHEEQMINNFRSEMESKIKEKEQEQERSTEEEVSAVEAVTEHVIALETTEAEITPAKNEDIVSGDSIKVEVHATAVHHDQVLEPKMAHAMSHEISHSQAVCFDQLE